LYTFYIIRNKTSFLNRFLKFKLNVTLRWISKTENGVANIAEDVKQRLWQMARSQTMERVEEISMNFSIGQHFVVAFVTGF